MTRSELNKIKSVLAKGIAMDGIDIEERPSSGKIGYILSPVVIDATHIAWEYVKDPDYVSNAVAGGTYVSPVEYSNGMEVEMYTNSDPFNGDGWYTYDGDVKICIKSGIPSGFDDEEYFAYSVD